ncbi:KUP/HAK/KT family potassium transporter [Vagococcus entomophilus]|uniref:Probable potassium transport system protein Kup n=1 Tax=Vagococcus entomophilus TaxID=1160095 RepID=A0A430AFV0_9ENTE|nr:potassium transporter Kup [Vagococcus entomophilus]
MSERKRKVKKSNQDHHVGKVKIGGLLIAMGVVFGDIGTSPLYVMKAIIEGNGGLAYVSEDFILGSVSLVFWVLTLLTTIKYVTFALRADNHGEGGIFSLYTLVRKISKYLIYPAMIGGAALLADSMLTPAMTITSAVEGLQGIPLFFDHFGYNQNVIIVIALFIMLILFSIQRFGTTLIGKAFGPIMLGWFTFIAAMGIYRLSGDLSILRALNPYYAIHTLFSDDNKKGLLILGSILLATTGAEDLYADLGHVGRKNIRISWAYVKVCLLLNYFGQAAWIISVRNQTVYQNMEHLNPFFQIIPKSISLFSVIFATIAAIIASQALISGSYTLVSEAIKLKLLPRLRIYYPSKVKGQLYIPVVNTILMLGSMGIVLYFRTSAHMESAYGLAITVTMMMTTTLLFFYFRYNRSTAKFIPYLMLLFFGPIEIAFFVSNLAKLFHGGYVAVLIALFIFGIMLIWERGSKITEQFTERVSLYDYMGQLNRLTKDESIPVYQTNIVFLTSNLKGHRIGKEIMYSILDKRPKRAKVYWFVNVLVTDEPYTREYYVDMMGTNYIVNVQLHLGFKVEQEVNVFLRQIVTELMEEGKLPKQPQRYSTTPNRQVGDFCFVLIREELSRVKGLKVMDRLVMQAKLAIKKITVSPARWFGLEYSDVKIEHVPITLGKKACRKLTQVQVDEFTESDEEVE